jgi:hypothetical protein
MWSAVTLCRLIALAAGIAAAPLMPAEAARLWQWSYHGDAIHAGGTFTTGDTADAAGCFPITGVTGSRNGVAITGLQPAGTPIPGNAPYAVDNLVCTGGAQLTGHGFGFALADGSFVNPFFADFRAPKGYLEFFSANGVPGHQSSELRIVFTAATSSR